MSSKKFALAISGIALVAIFSMFVGMSSMLQHTASDLGTALDESSPTPVAVKPGISTEAEAAAAADKAYAVVTEAFRNGAYDSDTLIAYELSQSGQAADYAQPLGESTTVWAGRSQTLASIVTMEVIGIGALAFVIGFIASRIARRVIS